VRLILASASPRRAELLQAAGIAFDVDPAHVDEGRRDGEGPDAYVRRIAETKAHVSARAHPGRVVLAADTVVVVDGDILGKPRDGGEARVMLRRLSGRWHEVLTGVCLAAPGNGPGPGVVPAPGAEPAKPDPVSFSTRVESTRVEFAPLTPEDIDWYVASGEPLDKAGAYAVQGLASRWVTRIVGSYSHVVGLPVAVVHRMCTAAGLLVF
jgi:septum formation protein